MAKEEIIEEIAIGPIIGILMALGIFSGVAVTPTNGDGVPPVLSLSIALEPSTESPEPGVIYAGGMMTIRAILSNGTSAPVDYLIQWIINDEVMFENYRRINPGNVHDQSYRYTVPSVGEYAVKVTVDGLEATDSFTTIPAPPGEPDIHDSRSSPLCAHLTGGEGAVWGSLWTFNDGNGTGSYVLEWYIDDVLIRTHSGLLAPGAYDCNEIYVYDSEYGGTPGTYHTMHCLLKWNGHEDRYPIGGDGYKEFYIP